MFFCFCHLNTLLIMLLSVYTFTCYALSVAPVTYYNRFYRYCDSHLFIHCCEFFFAYFYALYSSIKHFAASVFQ